MEIIFRSFYFIIYLQWKSKWNRGERETERRELMNSHENMKFIEPRMIIRKILLFHKLNFRFFRFRREELSTVLRSTIIFSIELVDGGNSRWKQFSSPNEWFLRCGLPRDAHWNAQSGNKLNRNRIQLGWTGMTNKAASAPLCRGPI